MNILYGYFGVGHFKLSISIPNELPPIELAPHPQLLYLTLVTYGVGRLPNAGLRKWMYGWAARTCFRVLSRSFSAVIHFHDTQYRKGRFAVTCTV